MSIPLPQQNEVVIKGFFPAYLHKLGSLVSLHWSKEKTKRASFRHMKKSDLFAA